MSPEDFKIYYQNSTKLEKSALNIAEKLFCYPNCTQECPNPCQRHPQPHTLKERYISNNQEMTPRIPENPLHLLLPQQPQPQPPTPPSNVKNNPIWFPIYTITNHKTHKTKDKHKITKIYNTYLCQWTLQNNITYNQWIPQRELFPLNQPTVINHNINLLKKYYTKYQHRHYRNIINTHFTPEQTRDTRFIPPPTIIPCAQISITECNPKKDINTNKSTIQTQNEITHIYDDTGKHLITIPTTRL